MNTLAVLLRKELHATFTSPIAYAVSMAVSVAISILAAYSLTRLRFPGRHAFGIAVFITYLVPPTLLFLPLTQIVNWLGLSDTLWALLLTYPTFLIPFCTWLLLGYFKVVPREIEECALVDGCSRVGVLFRIVIPIAIPGIICALLSPSRWPGTSSCTP